MSALSFAWFQVSLASCCIVFFEYNKNPSVWESAGFSGLCDFIGAFAAVLGSSKGAAAKEMVFQSSDEFERGVLMMNKRYRPTPLLLHLSLIDELGAYILLV